jgi:hypothetical protein
VPVSQNLLFHIQYVPLHHGVERIWGEMIASGGEGGVGEKELEALLEAPEVGLSKLNSVDA